MRTALRLVAALVAAAALTTAATAVSAKPRTANVVVGIGDQHASMFANPLYKKLHLKRSRYFVAWNAIDNKNRLAAADGFIAAAAKAHVSVLLTPSTDNFNPKKAKLPSVKTYTKKVGALIKRYRARVKEWGVWNEANDATEPTYRNPKRAGQFVGVMHRLCHGCSIEDLDVSARSSLRPWMVTWMKGLTKKARTSRLTIGIHDYADPNDNTSRTIASSIRVIRRLNRRAHIWLTETGGLAYVAAAGTGHVKRKCSLSRQKLATRRTFSLAHKFDKDLERMYQYNWTGTGCKGFDAGLVGKDGKARPAYTEFVKGLKLVRK